jgi:hypothetical protein
LTLSNADIVPRKILRVDRYMKFVTYFDVQKPYYKTWRSMIHFVHVQIPFSPVVRETAEHL